jgi:hypothetical protein
MKCLIYLAIALLALAPTALGAVGTVGQSEGSASSDLMRSYHGEAPSLKGPYEEGFSPTELKFGTPEMYSFSPDDRLSFVSATPQESVVTGMEGDSGAASGSWYWPGSVESQNKLYVQTRDGVTTVAGCSNGGYLPLWAKVAYTGNFFVYEWYPNKLTPTVNWCFWTWPDYLKGWFKGDDPGWHIICFHCDKSSNYVYIYVWPESGSYTGVTSGSYAEEKTTGYSKIVAPQTMPSSSSLSSGSLSTNLGSATPTPPDPVSEGLMPTDLRLPAPDYSGSADGSSGCDSYTTGTMGACAPTSGVSDYGVYASGSTGYSCYGTGTILPTGYSAGTDTVSDFGLVYTPMAASKYNEYFVQTRPNRLTTVASTQKGEWLQLWSKIKRPGMYWSFEWPPCKSGYYCAPEVKSLGYKKEGWYTTWFKSSTPGWHLLCYQCNDWSNYVYIYVWPFDC